jgi:hypothetical protein
MVDASPSYRLAAGQPLGLADTPDSASHHILAHQIDKWPILIPRPIPGEPVGKSARVPGKRPSMHLGSRNFERAEMFVRGFGCRTTTALIFTGFSHRAAS